MRKFLSKLAISVLLFGNNPSVFSMELLQAVDPSEIPLFQSQKENIKKETKKTSSSSWEVNVPEQEMSPVESSLMEVVLNGELLDKDGSKDREDAYEASITLLVDRLIPETHLEEPKELLEFYKIMSDFETARMKYFTPLLDHFLRKVQKELLEAEEESTSHRMLAQNAELIREVKRLIEQRMEVLEDAEDSSEAESGDEQSNPPHNEEGGSQDEDETPPDESDSPPAEDSETPPVDSENPPSEDSESDQPKESEEFKLLKQEILKNREALSSLTERIDSQVDMMIDLKKSITSMRSQIKEHGDSLKDMEGKLVQEELQVKMKELEEQQKEILKLMRKLSQAQSQNGGSGSGGSQTAPGTPEAGNDTSAGSSQPVDSGKSKVKVPFLFEYKVYGNDRSGVQAIINAGSLSVEGSEDFDPRVYKVLNSNGARWSKALGSFAYKSLPTGLTNELGNEGVIVKPGSQAAASPSGKKSYQKAIVEFLAKGGKECFAMAARKAKRDSSQESLRCE